MTTREILEHDEYFNPYFLFEGEVWGELQKYGFSNYKQSNKFRVKSVKSNKIIKPVSWSKSKFYFFKITNDKGTYTSVKANDLFDDFDVLPDNQSEFIYNMF